ncbi:MAG: polyprenyl diphosphate synthase [Acutalibacteraceae bacterium]|jgi:undecaprenyl diphosphate synthase
MPENTALPVHIGIIMDGNGRWATQRGLPRSRGHEQGAQTFRTICEYAADIGIKYLTFYAFSTENWSRPAEEINAVMDLFRDYLKEAEERQEENIQKGFRIRYIGDTSALPEDIRKLIRIAERESAQARKTTVNLAVNYGGRQEILHSVRSLARRVQSGEITPDEIRLEDIQAGLYTAGQPDPDLIIRPSGEYRLSNFLIWQAAYTEFWYSDILWPDFTPADLDRAIEDYGNRNRRFGGI